MFNILGWILNTIKNKQQQQQQQIEPLPINVFSSYGGTLFEKNTKMRTVGKAMWRYKTQDPREMIPGSAKDPVTAKRDASSCKNPDSWGTAHTPL